MPTIEIRFSFGEKEHCPDLYTPFLFDYGCDGLVEGEEEGTLLAYIQSDRFDRSAFLAQLRERHPGCTLPGLSFRNIRDINWNKAWEESYKPVLIAGSVFVRAPFHEKGSNHELEVVISPRMSFGTGHHETTRLMAGVLLSTDLAGRKVIDVGCGTGILGIIAALRGAASVTAVDSDPHATENTIENFGLNNLTGFTVVTTRLETVDAGDYDVVMANISRNVIYERMDRLTGIAGKNALLLLSGFLEKDARIIAGRAGSYGWTQVNQEALNDWSMLVFSRE